MSDVVKQLIGLDRERLTELNFFLKRAEFIMVRVILSICLFFVGSKLLNSNRFFHTKKYPKQLKDAQKNLF